MKRLHEIMMADINMAIKKTESALKISGKLEEKIRFQRLEKALREYRHVIITNIFELEDVEAVAGREP